MQPAPITSIPSIVDFIFYSSNSFALITVNFRNNVWINKYVKIEVHNV